MKRRNVITYLIYFYSKYETLYSISEDPSVINTDKNIKAGVFEEISLKTNSLRGKKNFTEDTSVPHTMNKSQDANDGFRKSDPVYVTTLQSSMFSGAHFTEFHLYCRVFLLLSYFLFKYAS